MVGDPQNEITVDPRIGGGDKDDMSFAVICSRKSYLTNFSIDPEDPPFQYVFEMPVHPQLSYYEEDVANTYFQPTTLGFVAQPHCYWTGSISYRFVFQTSAYDRMKVGFWWEPNNADNDLNLALRMNKQAMVVLDLATAQSVDLTVHWGNDKMWLECVQVSELVALTLLTKMTQCNGRLMVCPITRLQTPDGKPIEVTVFTWSDDIRFNLLDTTRLVKRRIYAQTQSGEITSVSINRCHMDTRGASLLHFGEEPISFRAELKRYEFRTDFGTTLTNAQYSVYAYRRIIPIAKPAYGSATTTTTLLEYLMYAYLGVRGSLRRQLYLKSTNNMIYGRAVARMAGIEVTRTDDTVITASTGLAGYGKTPYALTALNVNPCLEIETPYVSSNLFQFAFAGDSYGSSVNMEERQSWRIIYFADAAPSSTVTFAEAISIGEDFNLLQFCGSPFFSVAK
jgi:hypothetical protein